MRTLMVLALGAFSTQALAQAKPDLGVGRDDGKIGIGAQLGLPTGVSGKYFVESNQSAQLALGVSPFVGGYWVMGGNYLFEQPTLVEQPTFDLGWYIGPGFKIISGNLIGSQVGPIAAAGMVFNAKDTPVDVSLQLEPGLLFQVQDGRARPFVGLAIASHYYF